MHPEHASALARSHQTDLLAQAERVRHGRPLSGRPRLRRRWRSRFAT